MSEAEWLACMQPQPMLDLIRMAGSARKSRLFACACCRRIWDLLTTPCSRAAVEVAEKFADGLAPEHERAAAFAVAIREANGWANCCGLIDAGYAGGVFAAAFAVADVGTVEDTGDAVIIAEASLPDFLQTPVLIAAFDSSSGAGCCAGAWVQANRDGNVEEEYDREWEVTALAVGAVGAALIGVSAVTDETDEYEVQRMVQAVEEEAQCVLIRDIFGSPFRPVALDPTWVTPAVTSLARAAYEERALPSGELDRTRLAILSDALEEAGCSEQAILDHLRSPGPHFRGCWLVDLLIQRE